MDKTRLFLLLSKRDSSLLLNLLRAAYDEMNHDQRQAVFGRYYEVLPLAPVDGEILLKEVETFRRTSFDGAYYAPFNVNSRNYRHVPDETKEWFDLLGELLVASSRLTEESDHVHAVACFEKLYELIGAMERAEEIVFADEYGSWMIPGNEKLFVAAYLTSLAATCTPEEFTRMAVPLIQRDRRQSFTTGAYASAVGAATQVQRAQLEAETQRRNIRTGRDA